MLTQNERQHSNGLVVLSRSSTIQAQLTVILETILMKVPSKTTSTMYSEGSLHSDRLVRIHLDVSRIHNNGMNSLSKESNRGKVKGGGNDSHRSNNVSHLKLHQDQNNKLFRLLNLM